MRWIIYAAALALAFLIPVERTDVGKLCPVEVVTLAKSGEGYEIGTDLGVWGYGPTISDAVTDLKQTASGIVYLDTAKYLLSGPVPGTVKEELCGYLKTDVRVVQWDGYQLPETAAWFLDTHVPNVTLKSWKTGQEPEILCLEGDRLRLEK